MSGSRPEVLSIRYGLIIIELRSPFMMRLEVASVCICLLLISPIISQNVSAKLPVG